MSQSNVVNLLDRASVMVDEQQLGEWLIEWAKVIASGEYGEVRTAMIVIETPTGIAQVHQSTGPSDRTRLVGLLAGTSAVAFTAQAASSTGLISGSAGMAFDATGDGLARAGMVAESVMVLATVGALLARAAGQGAADLVITGAGEIRGDIAAAGISRIGFVAGLYVHRGGRVPYDAERPHDRLGAAERVAQTIPPAAREQQATLVAERP